jgi:hypothetical protein
MQSVPQMLLMIQDGMHLCKGGFETLGCRHARSAIPLVRVTKQAEGYHRIYDTCQAFTSKVDVQQET